MTKIYEVYVENRDPGYGDFVDSYWMTKKEAIERFKQFDHDEFPEVARIAVFERTIGAHADFHNYWKEDCDRCVMEVYFND